MAMGYMESSIVVYLREIMYPSGFDFPLSAIDPKLAITEIFREVATLIMLLSVGYLGGKTFSERFAWFIYCFAIWDIFYYVFLKALINWPGSLMTWDILFLIPTIWTSPVLAPVITSLTMILLALVIVHFSYKTYLKISWKDWGFLIAGSLVLIMAFTWDYSKYVLTNHSFSKIWTIPGNKVSYDIGIKYIPESFNWWIFWLGESIILSGIVLFYRRLKAIS